MNIAVVIASLGRPASLAEIVDCLAEQSEPPAQVVLSVTEPGDAPPIDHPTLPVDVAIGPRGLCVQRNRGLDRLRPDIDLVVFYDDDFVPSRYALENIGRFFADHPGIAGADGLVLADGIKGPGIPAAEARRMVEAHDNRADAGALDPTRISHRFGLYGCNMVYRTTAIGSLRFDEQLPLYAWWDDLDFGGRIDGELVNTTAFWGVHCGEKSGRDPNARRLGYSQVTNPIYMVRKGTVPAAYALRKLSSHILINHARALRPEPWVDRRSRAAGNWLAIVDIARGRVAPERILEF